jgi:hypothetical protein
VNGVRAESVGYPSTVRSSLTSSLLRLLCLFVQQAVGECAMRRVQHAACLPRRGKEMQRQWWCVNETDSVPSSHLPLTGFEPQQRGEEQQKPSQYAA